MSSNWLSKELSTLLASPHISFPKPPAGIHLGPGPIDLFSTNFNNLFASDVETIVDGEPVSRDDLKQKLLNLQKRWNPEKVKFVDSSSIGPNEEGTEAILGSLETVRFIALINKEGGNAVIKRFAMSGDPSVFQTP